MRESKFNTILTVLLIIAIIGIFALIGYFSWAAYSKYSIETNAEEVASDFEETAKKEKEKKEEEERLQLGGVEQGSSIYETNKLESKKYYGYAILGTISIPKINIKYPILEKSTTQSIKVAVAYLSGVGINKVGNTVIQGHNYRNGLFFSNLAKLSNGDKIYITDTSGEQVTYEVYSVSKVNESDASFYKRDTKGLREITLSTCTNDGGVLRTVVLAKEVV